MYKYIVSMTSWPKRISDVGITIFSLLMQTIRPQKIILNLSTAEFASIGDLPDDIHALLKVFFPLFEINWISGPNTKAFKKVIPIIERCKHDEYFILSADDDIIYLPGYAEKMVSILNAYPSNYITPGTWGNHVHGYAMIYNSKWFTDNLLYSLSKTDMDSICSSDLWISEVLAHEHISPIVIPEITQLFVNKELTDTALSQQYTTIPYEQRKTYCKQAIRRFYGK